MVVPLHAAPRLCRDRFSSLDMKDCPLPSEHMAAYRTQKQLTKTLDNVVGGQITAREDEKELRVFVDDTQHITVSQSPKEWGP